MRMYYIFNVKKEIIELYKDCPSSLFKILNSIYYLHHEEKEYGFNLLKQLTKRNNVDELNRKLYIFLHSNIAYSKNASEHIINDLYGDEISILKVRKSHLLLQSNRNYTFFFDILKEYNTNFFVCDFLEKDFFFIYDISNYANQK